MTYLDPLSGHADPRLYVPLDTSERLLAEISAYLKRARSPLLLTGPAGVGKTILLRVLVEREWKMFQRVRFSPLLLHEPEELSEWLLHLLFRKPTGGSPEAEDALLEQLHRSRADPILLVVDNIQRTPVASVRKLGELAFAARPALAVLVAGTDDRAPNALAESFAPEATVAFPDSLPDVEIEELYEAILDHPGLSTRLRHRLVGVERSEIALAAAGIPRLLKRELVRRNELRHAPPRVLPRAQRTPHLQIVRAPVAAVLEQSDRPKPTLVRPLPRPLPPREVPAPRPAAQAAARFANPVAIVGRVAPVARLLIGTCAYAAGMPLALAAALSHSKLPFRDSVALRAGSEWLARVRASAVRVSSAIEAAARRGGAVIQGSRVASARRNALRMAPIAAVPATALLALALFSSLGGEEAGPQPSFTARAPSVALAQVGVPAPVIEPVNELVNVQVYARPWARVSIDGVDVGPTPLTQRLAPGVYLLEAEFASGERIERKIEVGPKRRFVSLREPAPKRLLQAATDGP